MRLFDPGVRVAFQVQLPRLGVRLVDLLGRLQLAPVLLIRGLELAPVLLIRLVRTALKPLEPLQWGRVRAILEGEWLYLFVRLFLVSG